MLSSLNLLNFKNSFPILLIILLPPATVSGPAIPDVILSLLGLIFIFVSYREKLKQYYLNIFSIWFLIFYFIILTSSLLSFDPLTSLFKRESFFYFRFYLFSLSVCYFVNKYPLIIKYLAFSILITIIIVIIDGSFEYFRGISLFGVHSAETRLFGLFIDEPIVGRFISSSTMLFVCLMIYFYGYDNNKIILLIFFILMLGEVFTFMSGERSAFGMIVAFSIGGLVLVNKRRIERLLFIIITIISVLLLTFFQDRTGDRIEQTFNEVQSGNFVAIASSPIHDQHYSSAILMFKENPIWGIGSNLFRHACSNDAFITGPESCTTHPHHYYIQILAENGLIGFITFFLVFLMITYKLTIHFAGMIFKKEKIKIDDKILPLYIFLFVIITPFLPHGGFYNNWTNVPIFIGLGIFLSIFIKNNKIG